jgi:AraC-like DNA-binding protein
MAVKPRTLAKETVNARSQPDLDLCGSLLDSLTDRRLRFTCEKLSEKGSFSKIDAAEVAKALNISTSRFRHLFKQETGIPFARFLKLVRIAGARELLLNSPLNGSVAERDDTNPSNAGGTP